MGKRGHNRVHSQVNSSRGVILSGFSPSGSSPIPPTSHCRSEAQLRNRAEGLYSNNKGADPTPNRTVTTIEQRGDSSQYLGQALVTTTPIKPPIKGLMVQASGQTSPTRGQTPEERTTMLQPAERRAQTQFDKMR